MGSTATTHTTAPHHMHHDTPITQQPTARACCLAWAGRAIAPWSVHAGRQACGGAVVAAPKSCRSSPKAARSPMEPACRLGWNESDGLRSLTQRPTTHSRRGAKVSQSVSQAEAPPGGMSRARVRAGWYLGVVWNLWSGSRLPCRSTKQLPTRSTARSDCSEPTTCGHGRPATPPQHTRQTDREGGAPASQPRS